MNIQKFRSIFIIKMPFPVKSTFLIYTLFIFILIFYIGHFVQAVLALMEIFMQFQIMRGFFNYLLCLFSEYLVHF